MTAWWSDFEISRKEIYVRATDIRIPITWAHTKDVLNWFTYYSAETLRGLPRIFQKPAIRLACVPTRPRAWYLLWAAATRAGFDLNASAEHADALLYFEDTTSGTPILPQDSTLPVINANCTDISKTHVQAVFARVFGYRLDLDPKHHKGAMVEKSDLNGIHDGRIIDGPATPRAGYVYQRVINNSDGRMVLDLRCPTAGGSVDLIYLKQRPVGQRFDNLNTACRLAKPEDHLSMDERTKLSEFCSAMGLDWGGLDVLRDKTDGKIYVVDVNKTDMGPPLALPLKDKLRSVSILADSLTRMVKIKKAQSQ